MSTNATIDDVHQYSQSFFLEGTSEDPREKPTVLFNMAGGPITHVEILSRVSEEHGECKVYLSNGTHYWLEGFRADTFLAGLRGARRIYVTETRARAGR